MRLPIVRFSEWVCTDCLLQRWWYSSSSRLCWKVLSSHRSIQGRHPYINLSQTPWDPTKMRVSLETEVKEPPRLGNSPWGKSWPHTRTLNFPFPHPWGPWQRRRYDFSLPFLVFAIRNACLDNLTWEPASTEGDNPKRKMTQNFKLSSSFWLP